MNTIENAHDLSISALLCPSSSDVIISGGRDYQVKIWDSTTLKCIQQYSAPRNIVTCMQSDPINPHIIYQGSEDLCIRIWDKRVPKSPVIHVTGFVYFPLCLSTHIDSPTLLAVGCKGVDGQGGEVRLYDLRGGSGGGSGGGGGCKVPVVGLLAEYTGHQHDVTACQLIPSSSSILSVSKDGHIYAWDYSTTPNSDSNTSSGAVPEALSNNRPPSASYNTLGSYLTCMTIPTTTTISSNTTGTAEVEKGVYQAYIGAFDGSVSELRYEPRASKEEDKLHMRELTLPYFTKE